MKLTSPGPSITGSIADGLTTFGDLGDGPIYGLPLGFPRAGVIFHSWIIEVWEVFWLQ